MNKRNILSAVVALVGIVGLVFVLSQSRLRRHAQSTRCANAMASISLAARMWADDHEGRTASNFLVMADEITTPKVLVCPSDPVRQRATNWASFTPANCSYEIVSPGLDVKDTQRVYFRCLIHGHLGYPDGTVYDGKRRRTKAAW